MKKHYFLIQLLLLLSFGSMSQTTKWNFDKTHSTIQFNVAHMVISKVSGLFHQFEGSVLSEKEDFTNSKIELTIDAKSIDTDDANRDKHLKGTDFFDVNTFPKIVFKSKSFIKVSDNTYLLVGNLTMHGITKAIKLNVKYGGTVNSGGNTKAGFKVMGTINRTDFGLKYNSTLDTGGLMIGENVDITCRIELSKQK